MTERRVFADGYVYVYTAGMFDVILDRDGILNVDVGYTHRLEDFQLTDRLVEGLQQLRDAGARFSIATGQSGIARGKYGEEDMQAFNQKMIDELAKAGITVAAVAFCPHHPEHSGDCDCRKPKTGMLDQIEAKIGPIDWSKAWGIGDKPSDAEMILSKGGSSVLVKHGSHNEPSGDVYWEEDDPKLTELLANPRNFVAATPYEAMVLIAQQEAVA